MNNKIDSTEQKTNDELLNSINKDEFELRERRLKLVYKILYIFAISLGVISLIAVKYIDKNPVEIKSSIPLFCFLLSFLSTGIISILSYAFRELKCMKINSKNIYKDKQDADTLFVRIWQGISLSIFFSLYFFILSIFFYSFISNFYTIGIVLFLTLPGKLIVWFIIEKKSCKWAFFINTFVNTISAYLIFTLAFTATLTV